MFTISTLSCGKLLIFDLERLLAFSLSAIIKNQATFSVANKSTITAFTSVRVGVRIILAVRGEISVKIGACVVKVVRVLVTQRGLCREKAAELAFSSNFICELWKLKPIRSAGHFSCESDIEHEKLLVVCLSALLCLH